MAGDWIKMRVELPTDPSTIIIAQMTGLDEDTVVGKLHRVWSWTDQQTSDGNARGVTQAWLDRYVGVTGFAAAMEQAGWLEVTEHGLHFPNYEEHNGQTGKRRALAAKRAAKHRKKSNADSNATSVTKSAPRGEERRVDKKNASPNGEAFPETHEASAGTAADTGRIDEVLQWVPTDGEPKRWPLNRSLVEHYVEVYPSLDVQAELRAAIEWLAASPSRRKTFRGMRAFLTSWLNRSQNRGGCARASPANTRGGHKLDLSFTDEDMQ